MMVLSVSINVSATWETINKQVNVFPLDQGEHNYISIQAQPGDILEAGGSSNKKTDYYLLSSGQYQDYINVLDGTVIGFAKVAGAYKEKTTSTEFRFHVSVSDIYYLLVDNTDTTGEISMDNLTVSIWLDLLRETTNNPYYSETGIEYYNSTYYNNETVEMSVFTPFNIVIICLLGTSIAMTMVNMNKIITMEKIRKRMIDRNKREK